jgi:muramidase (phage lysozyme)
MINTAQTVAQLADMTDDQLQKYAAMHKNDPYLLPLALSESARRKRIRQSEALKMAGQQQPKVADQAVAGMAPAPQLSQIPAGVPQLQARNIETMADGGIAGYAGGGNTFDATPYLQDPNVQRFLAYINTYEGSPKPNQTVGYHEFNDMSRHPNRRVKFNKRGDRSTAAGAYQILNKTWEAEAKRQGLQDFSLENQQRAAIGVLKDVGALNHIVKGDFDTAKKKAAKAWASLPGSTIGESTGQTARFKPLAEQYLAAGKPTAGPVLAQAGTREAPRTPEMLALQQAARRRRAITEMLPFGAAQAGELPPQMSVPSSGAPNIRVPAARPQAQRSAAPAAPAPLPPASLAIGQKLMEGQQPPAPPPPTLGQLDYLYSSVAGPGMPMDVPTPENLAAEKKRIEELKKAEKKKGSKAFREILGAPEAAASFLSGAIAPATGLVPFGLSQFTDKPMTFGEAMDAATFAPRSEVGKESLSGLYQAVEDYKIPPYFPGIGAPRRAPAKGPKARAAALATEAELEATKNKYNVERGRITGPAPEPVSPFAADVAAAARARTAKPSLAAQMEQARAMEEARANRSTFPVAPETAAFGEEALARRRAAEQARAAQKGTPAETKLTPEAALEADKQRIAELEQKLGLERDRASEAGFEDLRAREDMAAKRAVAGRYDAGRQIAGGLAGAETRGPGEVPPDLDDSYMTSGMGEYKFGKEPTPFESESAVKKTEEVPAAAEPAATPKKKGFDFSDEDWLMMGLNMLQAPAGQTGSALQQLGANIGRSGLATLGAKREREERELDRLYKTVYADYYKGLTKQLGQGDTKMQMVKRIMDEQNIPFSKALELYNQYEYAPKMEAALQKAYMNPQLQALMEMDIIDRGGLGFTPKGTQLFGNAGYNIPAYALPQGVKVFKE